MKLQVSGETGAIHDAVLTDTARDFLVDLEKRGILDYVSSENHVMHTLTTGWQGEMTEKKSQLERFKEAARQLETDDDEAKFNEKLRKLAKAGTKPKLTDESESESMDKCKGL